MQKQRIVLKLAIFVFVVISLGLSFYLIIDYNQKKDLKFDNRENISRNIIVEAMQQKLDKYKKESTLDNKDNNILEEQNNHNNESNLNNDVNSSQNTNLGTLNNNEQNNSISNNQSNYTDDNSNNNSNQDSNGDNNNNNDNITIDNNSENQTTQIPVNDDINQDIDNRNDLHDTMELCTNAGFQVGFKDTEDILSTYCESVVINGKVKYKLYVICKSGNCDKYI